MRRLYRRSANRIIVNVRHPKNVSSSKKNSGKVKYILPFLRDISLVFIASAALVISLISWQDSRSIQALDIKPVVYVRNNMVIDGDSTFVLYNKGPIDIHQAEVDFFIQAYSEELNRFIATVTGPGFHYNVGSLEAKRHILIKTSPDITYQIKAREKLRKINEEAVGRSAIELRLSYRCLPDYRRYVESAVYYVADDNKIVGESNNLISNKEPYISMTKEIFKYIKSLLGYEWIDDNLNSDQLHLITPAN